MDRQLFKHYCKDLFVQNAVKKQQKDALSVNLFGIAHANAKKRIGKNIKQYVKRL